MTRLLGWLRGEPVAAISGAAGALLEVLVVFHLRLSDAERAAVMGAIPLALALITRQTVTPTPTAGPLVVGELVEQAPPLPPLPVLVDEISRGVVDRIAAREVVHAPARPRSHR